MTKQIRTRTGALLVTAALLTTACSSSTDRVQVEPTVSVPDLSAPTTEARSVDAPTSTAMTAGDLQNAFDELIAGVDGGAVAAVRVGDGALVTLASGTEPNGTALDPDAVVRVGSISKVVTSTLILTLVDAGELDLDATLGDILPDTPVGADSTIRQLLSHRTGIENYTDDPQFFESVLRRPGRVVEPADIVDFADPDDAGFAPGEDFSYSNTNYVLLGQVLEAITDEDLNSLVANRIADPLDLKNTSFDLGDRDDVIGGHTTAVPSGDTASFDYTSVASSAWAAGSLVTTVSELARFVTALFDGELISSELVAEMRQPIEAGADYGLGLHPGPDFGLGHGGAIPGFNSMLQHDPDTGDVLILVVNNDLRSPEALTDRLWEAANAT